MLTIRFTGKIAGAVAGEVSRIAEHPAYAAAEGAAYKAAWDRAGSNYDKHSEAFRRDCLMSSLVVCHPRAVALIAEFGPRCEFRGAGGRA